MELPAQDPWTTLVMPGTAWESAGGVGVLGGQERGIVFLLVLGLDLLCLHPHLRQLILVNREIIYILLSPCGQREPAPRGAGTALGQ